MWLPFTNIRTAWKSPTITLPGPPDLSRHCTGIASWPPSGLNQWLSHFGPASARLGLYRWRRSGSISNLTQSRRTPAQHSLPEWPAWINFKKALPNKRRDRRLGWTRWLTQNPQKRLRASRPQIPQLPSALDFPPYYHLYQIWQVRTALLSRRSSRHSHGTGSLLPTSENEVPS